MSDRYQALTSTPPSASCWSRTSACPTRSRSTAGTEGAPLVDGTVVVGGARPPRRVAGRPRSTTLGIAARRRQPSDGPEVQGPGLRRHRHRRPPTELVALQRVLHPAAAQPATVPAASSCSARRPSHRLRPRSGSPSARSRASPARSARRSAAAAPSSSCTSPTGAEGALASTLAFLLSPKSAYVSGQVVRIGAHGATTAAGTSPTGPSRWPARSRSSPAPAAASASRSPGCCTATARPSSASTYPRRRASCRR